MTIKQWRYDDDDDDDATAAEYLINTILGKVSMCCCSVLL